MSITIRRAELNDVYNISELNKACLPIYYSPIECFGLLLSLKSIILVAEENKKVIGYLIGEINAGNENYHIMSFGVNEKYRGKGVGGMIISFLINLIKKELSNITLYVHTENTKAIKFYEKNGFKNIETLENYYGGSLKETQSQNAHKMKKDLLL